jgi:hypothetical protein
VSARGLVEDQQSSALPGVWCIRRYRAIPAKMASLTPVNRQVAGSNPARGANSKSLKLKRWLDRDWNEATLRGKLIAMRSVDDILRRAKRLKRGELSRLVKQLDEHLLSTANGDRAVPKRRARKEQARHTRSRKRSKPSYAHTLALAGTAHSGWTDVSSHKGKHLAEVYAPRHEE